MKKTLSLLLSMTVLCCALTACGDRDTTNSDSKSESATESIVDETSEVNSDPNNADEAATDNNDGNIVTKAGDVVDDLVSTGEDIVDDAGSVIEDAGDAILGTDNNDNAR